MSAHPSLPSKSAFAFPGWSAALAADDSLSHGLREVYRLTVARFLKFCSARQVGPSVAGARVA